MLQLREELQRAKQTHSGEVEGMRKEVSKLTTEHQRDITVATLNGSSSGIRQQLRSEVERAEQKAAELKVSKETGLRKVLLKMWLQALKSGPITFLQAETVVKTMSILRCFDKRTLSQASCLISVCSHAVQSFCWISSCSWHEWQLKMEDF